MRIALGETPMTDPRSLAISLSINGLMLFVASLAVMGVVANRRVEALPKVLYGELDPVENLAPAESGGGGEEALGGTGAFAVTTDANGASVPPKESPADALLAELLPSRPNTLAPPGALPGPSPTGLGVMPGLGQGGGGGTGTGSGGGVGRGVGPGTEFFGVRERAGSFAYVIDCSGSMALRGALDRAKKELVGSLSQLPPDARFSVIFYNLKADVFSDARGKIGLMEATVANKARVRTLLANVVPDGGTDHMGALRAAFGLHPEVVFYLSDGDLMSQRDVIDLEAERGPIRIQAVELGLGKSNPRTITPLKKLALDSGGAYRYIDTSEFGFR